MTQGLDVSDEQAAAVAKVAKLVTRFGMTVPAILLLESLRPLSYIGSQIMHVLSPTVVTLLNSVEWDHIARLLEDRRGLDYIIEQIEDANATRSAR